MRAWRIHQNAPGLHPSAERGDPVVVPRVGVEYGRMPNAPLLNQCFGFVHGSLEIEGLVEAEHRAEFFTAEPFGLI